MRYSVREIYYTLQGEGANVGRPAVFCRFSGCNLWTGREEDRVKAICQFCDTNFVGTNGPGGGVYEGAEQLAAAIEAKWTHQLPSWDAQRLVVCTGGEPLLQLDEHVIDELHERNFLVCVETNGTLAPPRGIDWLTVSPKYGAELAVRSGDELKLVFPQIGDDPASYEALAFQHFFLQPMDGPHVEENTRSATDYCLHHPRWELSLQMHKLLGIP